MVVKSWISFLLPDDEYRERKILYFLSEGSIILLLFLIGILALINFVPSFQLDLEFSVILSIFIFSLYIFIRYMMSGMEYTEIVTEQDYKKELRVTVKKSSGFAVMFILSYVIFLRGSYGWFEMVAVSLVAGFIMFFSSYISLKRSYKKNKELL